MKPLISFPDDEKFYRGTIIVLKDLHTASTTGEKSDKKFAMIGGVCANFAMVDLYKSIGAAILYDLSPNVEGHFAVDKAGIKKWVNDFIAALYIEEFYAEVKNKLDEIIYIEDLSDYFKQVNRDIKVS